MSPKTISRIETLLRLLADGEFHSGEIIAAKLDISRTAVWKLIQKLMDWQIEVYSVRGKGYKIPGGLDLIDKTKLQYQIAKNQLFKQVQVLTSIDSTSNYLAKDWQQNPGHGRVCISEHQTNGRGRKGRAWISPFAANLYFSIGVQLPLGLSALGGLSLAVGSSLCESLNQLCENKIRIKWPNDLLVEEKKLAGILVEASGDSVDQSFLNIGVGINWNMQTTQGEAIDQPWINLKPLLATSESSPENSYDRNFVLALLLTELDSALLDYIRNGFSNIALKWPQISAMTGKKVTLFSPTGSVEGIEDGVENNGALRLRTNQGTQLFHSGEISLRGQQG